MKIRTNAIHDSMHPPFDYPVQDGSIQNVCVPKEFADRNVWTVESCRSAMIFNNRGWRFKVLEEKVCRGKMLERPAAAA